MTPPRDALLIGHPLIAVPVTLATLGLFAAGFYDPAWWIVALLMLWPAGAVARAASARTDYFQWKRAWEGMDAPASPAPRRSIAPARWRPWLGGAMLAAVMLFCLAHPEDPLDRLALVWLSVTMPIAGIVALIWRKKAVPSTKAKTDIVTVCVSGPLMPVPSLKDAYRALPDHCLTILGIARR